MLKILENKLIECVIIYFQTVVLVAFIWAIIPTLGQSIHAVFWMLWVALAPVQIVCIIMGIKDLFRQEGR